MSKNKQANLEELYTTDDLTLLKKSIAELAKKQDYKTLNTLLRRNPNDFVDDICVDVFDNAFR